ncbi:MAG: glycosyltransferase family 9 protein [Candidatus Omnitrophota bacterium]
MNIDLVRKVDQGVGTPLCFLLSLLERALRMFRPPLAQSLAPKKILFLKFSELGAIVLAYPLMARVKRMCPGADLYFVTFERNRELLKLMNGLVPAKNVFLVREDPLGFVWDFLAAIFRLRGQGIDVIFDLEFFSRVSAIFSYCVHAPKRIGFHRYTLEGLYRGDLLTHQVLYNPTAHITKNYLAMESEVGAPQKKEPQVSQTIDPKDLIFPEYASQETVRQSVLEKLRGFGIDSGKKKIFLMNAGEGMLPLREWPIENFVALAKRILENKEHALVIVGTCSAEKKSTQLASAVADPRCVNLIGQTTLEELLELFTMSHRLISNDCGLAHLAMLTPVRTVTIFGPESPRIFGSLSESARVAYADWPCSPCLSALNHRDSACRFNHCLHAIKVEDVFRVVCANP